MGVAALNTRADSIDFAPPATVGRGAAPALWTLGLLAAGYLSAREIHAGHSALWLGLAAAALIPAMLGRGVLCRVSLGAAVLLASLGWFTLRIHERPRDSAAFILNHDPLAEAEPILATGLVLATPRTIGGEGDLWPLPPRPRQVALDLRLETLGHGADARHVSGILRVRIDGPPEPSPAWLRAGAGIRLTGVLRPVRPLLNPGEPHRDLLAAQQGLVGTMLVPSIDLVAPEPAAGADGLRAAWIRLIAAIRDRVDAALGGAEGASDDPGAGRALLRAMLLGERDPLLREVESAFRRVGLVHIIAISGFNLAVLGWVVLLAVRLTGDRGAIEPILAAMAVVVYLLILPGEASIRRAGLTVLAFTVCEAMGRRYDRVALLAWIATVLLIVSPMDLWSLGFQLSFGIVAALLTLGSRVHERLWGVRIRGLVPTPRQRTWWWMGGSLVLRGVQAQISATLLAWAVAAPLIAHHTGLFSPIAPLASLVVLPVTVVMLVLGYTGIIAGLLIPAAAPFLVEGLSALGDAAVWMVTRIDEWPGATVRLPRLSVPWTLLATVTAVYWLGWAWMRDARAWILCLIASIWLAIECAAGIRLPAPIALRLDAPAVGDGSCVLVRSGRDSMLIDAGASGIRPDAEDLRLILRRLGVRTVRTVVITEPRVESWSLVPGAAAELGVRTVLLPRSLADAALLNRSGSHARLMRHLRLMRINLRVLSSGDAFALGRATVTMLGEPGAGEPDRLIPRITVHAGSIERSVVVASSASLTRLAAATGPETRADVLVLPRTVRAGDRPAAVIGRLDSTVLIHSAGPAQARAMRASFGPSDPSPMLTALGAVRAEIRWDGRVRSAYLASPTPIAE